MKLKIELGSKISLCISSELQIHEDKGVGHYYC